jgi:hypothetical protein
MEAVNTFNKTLDDFKENLKKCDDSIQFEKCKENDTVPLQKFLKSVSSIEDMIKSKDERIFNTPICIDEIDVSSVFKKISKEENRDAIWKFLQTLLLVGKTIKSKSKSFEEFFEKDGDNMIDMLKNLMSGVGGMSGMGGLGADDVDDTDDADDDDDSGSDEDIISMLENSKIGNLAKDISKDIDVSAFENIKLDSPDLDSIMKNLSSNDSIKDLITNVTKSVKEKMDSGEIDHVAMKEEAMKFMSKMKNNKKIKKMIKSQNMTGLMKEMMKDKGIDAGDDDFTELEEMFKKKPLPPADFGAMRGGGRRNAVRKRLKKKIEDKKED